MRTPRDARDSVRRVGWKDRAGGKGRMRTMLLTACALCLSLPAFPAHPAHPAFASVPAHPALESGQVPFEQAVADLGSPDAGTRLRAAQLLRNAAFPEAAIPLAPLLTDPQDEVQFAAIAAELNIFLVEPVVAKKRVALLVEVRNAVQAEPAFSAGPNALGARTVPVAVLTGLRVAARDQNPRVAIEALYAFGALAIQPGGAARRDLLRAAGPDLAAFIGFSDPAMRYAAVRVLGRVFAKRAQDEAIEPTVGDAVITALNDRDRAVKAAAMRALGSMRYARGLQALTDQFTFYRKGDAAETALDALAQIAHPTSVPLFIEQLASPSAALRTFAIEGLARTGDAAQLPAIQAMLEKEREASVTLAGAFASIMLGQTLNIDDRHHSSLIFISSNSS